LFELPGANERLRLLEADLLEEGSFDSCVRGAQVVFHTASPFTSAVDDPHEQLTKPSLLGTRNVFGSIGRALGSGESKPRVVLTSSIAAIWDSPADKPEHECFNEDDWNVKSKEEAGGHEAYRYSKVIAEREAWSLAASMQLELATILPAFIIGPPRTPRVDGESLRNMKQALEGDIPHRGDTNVVDVRDCAAAHIAAAETPAAVGKRFLLSSDFHMKRAWLLELLRERYPEYSIADAGPPAPLGRRFVCPKNLPMLGMALRDTETSILDMAATMLEHGIVKPKPRGEVC